MATNRPPARPPAPGGKGKTVLHGIGGRRPGVLIGGGAAVLVAVYALYKRSAGASSSNTTGTAATPTYDSSLTDFENEFENQIQALQDQLARQQPTPPNGTNPGHPVLLGGSPPTRIAGPVRAPAAGPSHTAAVVTVQRNNTLSGIAARFGETWQQVWAYNLAPGVRPAATDTVLRQRGPNLLYQGEQILIPKKN